MKSLLISIGLLLLFVLAFALGAKNQDPVTLDFLVGQTQMKTSVLLSLSFFLGFLLAWFCAFVYILGLKVRLARMRSSLNKLNQSLDVGAPLPAHLPKE